VDLKKSTDKRNTDIKSPGAQLVLDWLKRLGLPQYFEQLMDSGYENLEVCSFLDVSSLLTMGIHKPGHRKALLTASSQLKEKDNNIKKQQPKNTTNSVTQQPKNTNTTNSVIQQPKNTTSSVIQRKLPLITKYKTERKTVQNNTTSLSSNPPLKNSTGTLHQTKTVLEENDEDIFNTSSTKKTEQNQEVTIKSVEVSVSRSDIFSEEEEDIFAEK